MPADIIFYVAIFVSRGPLISVKPSQQATCDTQMHVPGTACFS